MNDFRDLIKEILWEKRSYQLSVAGKANAARSIVWTGSGKPEDK